MTDTPLTARQKKHDAIVVFCYAATFAFLINVMVYPIIWGGVDTFSETGAASYGAIARNIAAGEGYALDGTPTAGRPPLYPLFLAVVGQLNLSPSVAQAIVASSTAGLLAIIAARYTASKWSFLWVIGLLLILTPLLRENLVQRETALFTFLLVLGGVIFVFGDVRGNVRTTALLGLVLGLSALTRPIAYAGVLFVILLAAFQYRRRGSAAPVLAFVVSFVLILLPWGIRNGLVMGHFSVTATTEGSNLWKGNNPLTDEFYPHVDVDYMVPLLRVAPSGSAWEGIHENLETKNQFERSRYLKSLAVEYIKQEPRTFFKRALVKLYGLWTPGPIPSSGGSVNWVGTGVSVESFPLRDYTSSFLVLYIGTAIGAWRLRRTPFMAYAATWVLFLSVVHATTFGESRFRFPINTLFIAIAAVGFHCVGLTLRTAIRSIVRKR